MIDPINLDPQSASAVAFFNRVPDFPAMTSGTDLFFLTGVVLSLFLQQRHLNSVTASQTSQCRQYFRPASYRRRLHPTAVLEQIPLQLIC